MPIGSMSTASLGNTASATQLNHHVYCTSVSTKPDVSKTLHDTASHDRSHDIKTHYTFNHAPAGRHHSTPTHVSSAYSHLVDAEQSALIENLYVNNVKRLQVATPTPRSFSGRGRHALTWRSHGHSLAAYLWRHLRQTVVLPGKCTVWRRWRHS